MASPNDALIATVAELNELTAKFGVFSITENASDQAWIMSQRVKVQATIAKTKSELRKLDNALSRLEHEFHSIGREGSTLRRREYFDRSMETGAGGIYANAEDLLRWNKALDSPGLLSRHALELMFTAHPPGNYGYGWFVETSPRRKIYHEGGDPGFAAFEARYPDQHTVIIVLANEDDSPVRDIADAMAKHLFDD